MISDHRQEIGERTLSEIMRIWPQTVPVFLRHGMHCVGCRVSPFHTLDDACAEYRLEKTALVAELQDAINAAPRPRPA